MDLLYRWLCCQLTSVCECDLVFCNNIITKDVLQSEICNMYARDISFLRECFNFYY